METFLPICKQKCITQMMSLYETHVWINDKHNFSLWACYCALCINYLRYTRMSQAVLQLVYLVV